MQLKIQFSMSEQEAAKIHWGWHVIAWSMGGLGYLLLIIGGTGLSDPATMYASAATLVTMLALWSFIAVVFRKFF
jgi:ABC-type Na+ efflux pump permease subunit